ncbi:hypothetical protein AAHE18_03G077400 [Arachis hypogaea]
MVSDSVMHGPRVLILLSLQTKRFQFFLQIKKETLFTVASPTTDSLMPSVRLTVAAGRAIATWFFVLEGPPQVCQRQHLQVLLRGSSPVVLRRQRSSPASVVRYSPSNLCSLPSPKLLFSYRSDHGYDLRARLCLGQLAAC